MPSSIFFISSNGSMATQWLAKILSASPQIDCFHGISGLLPEGRYKLAQVIGALQSHAWKKSTFAGSVHLHNTHGGDAAKPIRGAKGVFAALVRNPIEVVNSQFIVKAAEPHGAQLAEEWRVNQRPSALPFEWLHPDDAVFGRVCAISLKHYFECSFLTPELLFQFEKYTQDFGEIQRLLSAITGGQISDCAAVAQAHRETGVLNRHHRRPVTWESIFFQEWDENKRTVFKRVYHDIKAGLPKLEPSALSRYPFLPELCAA